MRSWLDLSHIPQFRITLFSYYLLHLLPVFLLCKNIEERKVEAQLRNSDASPLVLSTKHTALEKQNKYFVRQIYFSNCNS